MSRYAAETQELLQQTLRETAFLGWIAGLFEGEGTVTITRAGRRGYTRALVSLTSTDKSMIEALQARWPGAIRTFQPRGNAREAQTWTLNTRGHIARFLIDIRPFLQTDRVLAKVDLAITDIGARIQGGRSPEYRRECDDRREAMRILNQRGKNHLGGQTVGGWLRPQLESAYASGTMPPLLEDRS